jgi:hypothetical protein
MTTRFAIDLTHPGWGQRSWSDWFLGPAGPRHLAIVAAAGAAIVVLVGLGGITPLYLRYASEVQSISSLRREATAADGELSALRTNLRDLEAEARRQVRWSEMLPVLSTSLPGSLRIDRVTFGKPARPPQAPPPKTGTPAADVALQIEASTTAMPGSSRLVDIANFIGSLAQDPAVAARFQLKNWEVRPPRESDDGLQFTVGFAEKRS